MSIHPSRQAYVEESEVSMSLTATNNMQYAFDFPSKDGSRRLTTTQSQDPEAGITLSNIRK